MTLVVSLPDPLAQDPGLVGAKAASLARLLAAGLPVPDGFCVTATAYQLFVDDPELNRRIAALDALDPADHPALTHAGKELRDRMTGRDMPQPLDAAIRTAAGALGGERFAVRSSATVEDRPEASAAGQHETFLGVAPAGVVAAVRGCMAGLFTDRAIAYRARHRIAHTRVALAVLVQRQVAADAAGVMFTADPQTGSRRTAVLEAVAGSGDRLVGGEPADYQVRIDRGSGAHTEESGDLLTGEQVRRLVALGDTVDREFRVPQDIEWALAGGEPVLLQARPVTGLFPLPRPQPTDGRLHLYLSWGHVQAFAEAMPPLVTDVWTAFINSVRNVTTTAPLATEAGGRIYIDLTPLLRIRPLADLLVEQMSWVSEPAAGGLQAFLADRAAELRAPESPGRRRSGTRPDAALVPALSRMLLRMAGRFARQPVDPRQEQAAWEGWAATAALAIRDVTDPVARVEAVFTPDPRWLLRLYPQVAPLGAAIAAGAVLEGWFEDRPDEVDDIGAGFPYDVATRMNLGLGDLADLARARPAVAEALRSGRDLDAIRTVEGGAEFGIAFERYLDEFGHRATGEIDLSRPRWREDPSPLLRVVAANLAGQPAGAHRERLRRLERAADAAAGRLAQRAGAGRLGPAQRRLYWRLLRTYRGHIGLREHPKQGLAYLFATWRGVLRDAGERLAAAGRLREPSEVWYLRRDELLAALRGGRLEVDIDARRAQHRRHAALAAPPALTSDGELLTGAGGDRDQLPAGALAGTPVSAGVAEGPARVLHDPSAATIQPGEILVTRSTDPGWTPLFLNASGLVTEVGGRLSHGALVAREYGLPAVAAVAGATTEIETGQSLRVDGRTGIVEILG